MEYTSTLYNYEIIITLHKIQTNSQENYFFFLVYLKFCVYTPYAFKIIEGILLLLDNDLANEHTFCLKSRKRKKVDNFKLFLKMLYIDMMFNTY
ncbi:hypothetical protein PFFCH_02394 [Plasmodium falciparum FCH/4]|uniref:Uncharacterized protein n=1 Tax=Plasmodium falciparum FCH/4 TaxID=1036724 RepID=A0A024VPE5_PLAFA|nr:hypothetical protein PFFCH_02394 [Plasmodium falciparum FCH/4]